ncbi:MAG: hypothetical protein KJ069_16400 [Anaerolineae bacterium]|nr:hypothetical protein [Anaerolineae bacterium]
MSPHLSNISQHLKQQYDREPQWLDENTILFSDKLNGLDASLHFVEEAPDLIFGFAAYLPPLQESEATKSELLNFREDLLKRNAEKFSASYGMSDDGYTIVKSGFYASPNPEETIVRFDEAWLDMRDLLSTLPTDVDRLYKSGLLTNLL